MMNKLFLTIVLIASGATASAACVAGPNHKQTGTFQVLGISPVIVDTKWLPETKRNTKFRGCHMEVKTVSKEEVNQTLSSVTKVYSDGRPCKFEIGSVFEGTIYRPCCDTPGATASDENVACLGNRSYIFEIRTRNRANDELTKYTYVDKFEKGARESLKNSESRISLSEQAVTQLNGSLCLKIQGQVESTRCAHAVIKAIARQENESDGIKFCKTFPIKDFLTSFRATCLGQVANKFKNYSICADKALGDFVLRCFSESDAVSKDCQILKDPDFQQMCFRAAYVCEKIIDAHSRQHCTTQQRFSGKSGK